MMEAILLLATIAQRFRLETVPQHAVVPLPGFTLRPKFGIKMILHQRAPTPQDDLVSQSSALSEDK